MYPFLYRVKLIPRNLNNIHYSQIFCLDVHNHINSMYPFLYRIKLIPRNLNNIHYSPILFLDVHNHINSMYPFLYRIKLIPLNFNNIHCSPILAQEFFASIFTILAPLIYHIEKCHNFKHKFDILFFISSSTIELILHLPSNPNNIHCSPILR